MKSKITKPKKNKETFHEKEAKGQEAQVLEASAPVTEPAKVEPKTFAEKPEATDAERIAESRKALDNPLPPGQKFFESPEGEIIIGEADKNQIWNRRMNGGQGGWCNPRR